jgi:alkylated DNA repair dioxygenase AlkB
VAATRTAPPQLEWQGSLLGAQEPNIDTAVRTELGGGAWVDVVPGWLTGADDLFGQLVGLAAWQERERPMYDKVLPEPRLSAWWTIATSPEAVRPLLKDAARALGGRYGEAFGTAGLNLYRSGRDSVAWHGDRHARRPEHLDAVIAVLSLGSTRRFLLRPTGGGPSVRFEPAGGDLLVMGGSCQRTWQHCVPKVASAGPRMSVTFRHPVATAAGATRALTDDDA